MNELIAFVHDLLPALDVAIKQAPNLLFAILAFYYLARQNARQLEAMNHLSERQFELIIRLCSRCLDEPTATASAQPE
jgi:hypothetical protein